MLRERIRKIVILPCSILPTICAIGVPEQAITYCWRTPQDLSPMNLPIFFSKSFTLLASPTSPVAKVLHHLITWWKKSTFSFINSLICFFVVLVKNSYSPVSTKFTFLHMSVCLHHLPIQPSCRLKSQSIWSHVEVVSEVWGLFPFILLLGFSTSFLRWNV